MGRLLCGFPPCRLPHPRGACPPAGTLGTTRWGVERGSYVFTVYLHKHVAGWARIVQPGGSHLRFTLRRMCVRSAIFILAPRGVKGGKYRLQFGEKSSLPAIFGRHLVIVSRQNALPSV